MFTVQMLLVNNNVRWNGNVKWGNNFIFVDYKGSSLQWRYCQSSNILQTIEIKIDEKAYQHMNRVIRVPVRV